MTKFIMQTRTTDNLAAEMAAGASSCTLTSGSFGSPTGKQIITLDYNVAAKAADFLCTIAGTAVTSMTRLNGPDVIHASGCAVAMQMVDEHVNPVFSALDDGWVDATNETWTYASATTFTIAGDQTSRYAVGDKIKLTQTTVKYFYVTAASYSAPNTTITITGGADYTLANAAITNNYFSKATSPAGFPQWFAWTPSYYKNDNSTALTTTHRFGRFSINGETVIASIKADTIGDPSGATIYFSLPVVARSDAQSIFVGNGDANTGGSTPTVCKAFILANQTVRAGVQYASSGNWGASSNSFAVTIKYELV